MLVSASRISGSGSPVAGEPDVGLLVEQLVDLFGQAHQQLALVAEVEVEGGARDAGARGDPLDVEVGVRRALGEQLLGGGAAPRPGSPRAWRWGPAPRWDSTDAITAQPTRRRPLTGLDTVSSFWSDPRSWPACSTSPPRATSRTITDESKLSSGPADDAAAALRAVGAPELGRPTRSTSRRTAATGRRCPTRSARRHRGAWPTSSSARSASPRSSAGSSMAYEDQHEEAFLTTQQVDEARHAQHFNRLYENVLQLRRQLRGPPRARCREQLNEHYIALFDEHLVNANRALLAEPARHRGQDRLRHDLPHGHRGDARADRPVLPDRLDGAPGILPGHPSRAFARSPRTSTATSPTAPGSCSRRPATRRSRSASQDAAGAARSRPAC